jgi:hypothetical protein
VSLIDEAQSAKETADEGLSGLGVVITILSFFVPSLVTALFSPAVAENSDSFIGVVFATFTWSTALFLATLIVIVGKPGLWGAIWAFIAAILVTSFIAGLIGLQTMPYSSIMYLAPSGHPALRFVAGSIFLAMQTYGPGGAALGAVVGIGSGMWLGKRIERRGPATVSDEAKKASETA